MANKRVKVTEETDSGLNKRFHDNYTNEDMSRGSFVGKIENGDYSNYHVRKINNKKIPVSNPDKTKDNNLG